jgi:hypothetical protein
MSDIGMRRELAMNRAIDKHLDEVVRHGNELARKLQGGAMRESQLRNVLNVATSTESIEVVANFIRYQIGRSSDWARNQFGESIIQAIGKGGKIYQVGNQVAGEVHDYLEKHAEEGETVPRQDELFDEAQMHLTRLLLGYLNRSFQYSDRTGVWDYAL